MNGLPPPASPAELALDPRPLEWLCRVIERHVAEGRQPGAQVAVARHGRLALCRSFGVADPATGTPVRDDTPFLLYSNTKVITAAALWSLVEEGRLGFAHAIAAHLPEFAAHGKGEVTLLQLLTHQAGFPDATVPPAAWPTAAVETHAPLRATVCDFRPEWPAGSRVRYHPAAAHWVAAALIEAVTGEDFRAVIAERVIRPLGLERALFVGLPGSEHGRAALIQDPVAGGGFAPRMPETTAAGMLAGIPGGGGYGTAAAMAGFYQVLGAGGALPDGHRIASPRMLGYVTRNFTAERIDEYMGVPMHRGLGPHSRGATETTRGLGSLAHPRTFGHGGVGSSYCWADPSSGVSFAFLSNCRQDEDFHRERMETLSNLVHAAILDG